MRHDPAVGIHHYLAAGQAGVGGKTAEYELSCRVDEYFNVFQITQDWCKEMLDELFSYFFLRNFLIVLCRAERSDDLAIADRHLRLAVGLEPFESFVSPKLLEPSRERVTEDDTKRKHFLCLVGRVSVHDSLIASAARINAHCNIRRLLCNRIKYFQSICVSDVAVYLARYSFKIDFCPGLHLAAEYEGAVAAETLYGNTAVPVLFKARIEYRIGYLIADFVGVA